jgi:hypothetical protein
MWMALSFIYFYLYLFISSNGTGISTQSFMLTQQVLYHLSHTFSPFCSGYFEDGISPAIRLG